MSSDDGIDDFLSELDDLAIELDVKPLPTTKTVTCFHCKDVVEVPIKFRLDSTCPPCYEKMKASYLKRYPL